MKTGQGGTSTRQAAPFFERLPARDACFLAFERPDLHMQVGAVAIFEASPLRLPSGELDIERIRRYMVSRLDGIERCRQRIIRIPIFGHPVWVDDQDFDITRHTHLVRAPGAGTDADLQALTGELLSRPLDRDRPLWEVTFVEGLEDPERIAVVVKLHHCMADGLAAIEFTRRFLSRTTETTFEEGPLHRPRPLPGRAALLRHEVRRWLRAPLHLGRGIRNLGRDRATQVEVLARVRSLLATVWVGLHMTSKTPLHGRVGPERRFAWTSMEMRDIRALRKQYGGSLNDTALGVLTGAVERVFAELPPSERPRRLRAMAPTSALTREQLQALGNRVQAPLVQLPLWEPTLARRMRSVQRETQSLVRNRQGLGWDTLMDLAEWTGVRSQQLTMWLATHMRAYNIVLTLLPGPHFPLYLLGSQMLEVYPTLPLLDHQTATIGVFRYQGRLHWGVVSTPEYAAALPALPPNIDAALAELLASAQPTVLNQADVDAEEARNDRTPVA